MRIFTCFVVEVYVTKMVVNLFVFRVCRAATQPELHTLSRAHESLFVIVLVLIFCRLFYELDSSETIWSRTV
jgi:hypothetical protein